MITLIISPDIHEPPAVIYESSMSVEEKKIICFSNTLMAVKYAYNNKVDEVYINRCAGWSDCSSIIRLLREKYGVDINIHIIEDGRDPPAKRYKPENSPASVNITRYIKKESKITLEG